jgi:hypothetical protein
MDITFTIPSNQVNRITDAMKFLFPIPQIQNPDYEDTQTTPEEPEFINEFSDGQWAKESVRRWIISQTRRYEEYQAKQAINIVFDNDLVS